LLRDGPALHRQRLASSKSRTSASVDARRNRCRGAHDEEAGLEIGLAEATSPFRRTLSKAERPRVAAEKGRTDGQKSDHRNDAKHNDPGAHRKPGENLRVEHRGPDRTLGLSEKPQAALRLCRPALSQGSAHRKMVNIVQESAAERWASEFYTALDLWPHWLLCTARVSLRLGRDAFCSLSSSSSEPTCRLPPSTRPAKLPLTLQ